jgi:transposase-like protein
MLSELDFTKHTVADFKFGLNQMFSNDLAEVGRQQMKQLIEAAVVKQFDDYIEVKRYRHVKSRTDYRNGFRKRSLMGTFGEIKDIRVPRSRTKGFVPEVFDRYKRVQKQVDDGILKMFLMGVSTRKVGDVLQALFGYVLSPSYVSKISKRLDSEVSKFHDRRLKDDFLYLFLDGIWIKSKRFSKSVKRVILTAYGVRANGSRQLIDFRLGKSESTGAWTTFLANLKVRGLSGSGLSLVASDGAPGLWAAANEVYPFVAHQLCWAHKLRNVSNKCPVRYRSECIAQARKIYLSSSVKIALREFRQWERTWRDRVPRVVSCLEQDIDKLLPFLNCPESHRVKVRTTNVIERQFREFRRRLSVMGTFPDFSSAQRMLFSLFVYHNTRWERSGSKIKEIALTYKKDAA